MTHRSTDDRGELGLTSRPTGGPRPVSADPYHDPQWKPVRALVLARDGHRCQITGPRCVGHATHVDHVVPWSEGGAWFDPANLRAACQPCNTGRGQARLAAMARLNRQPQPEPSRAW